MSDSKLRSTPRKTLPPHLDAEMIVIPFHHRYRHAGFGMIPIRTDDDGFMFVSPWCYDPEHYPPGSCIQ